MLILSERLHSVTAYFDGLRAVRFQEAIEKTTPRWRKGMVAQRTNEKGADIVEATRQERQPELESKHQLLDDETHALQVYIIHNCHAYVHIHTALCTCIFIYTLSFYEQIRVKNMCNRWSL